MGLGRIVQRAWLGVALVLAASACGAASPAADRRESPSERPGAVPPAMSGDSTLGGDTATGGDTGAGGSMGATGTDTSIRGARRYPIDGAPERDR